MRRAFVLRVSLEWAPGTPLSGQIEHVSSGESAQFHSGEELASIVCRLVDSEQDEPDAE